MKVERMRSSKIALTLLLIALAAGGGWWWWKSKAAASAVTPAATVAMQSVGVTDALLMDVPINLEASGTVAAMKMVDLRAQTVSTVAQVLIKDGQALRKGDLLFRFDDRADRANVDKARAQTVRDRATLADLERQYKRAQDLRAQNFIAQSAVDTALANLDAQRALLLADEAALQSATVALSYNEVRAPMAGRAGIVNVFPGSLVQANATALPLVSIAQLNPIAVSFTLPEAQLGPLLLATGKGKNGAKPAPLQAQVLMPDARTGRGVEGAAKTMGQVTFIDNQVDTSTGTIKVRAEFENSLETLWPGQYVRVRMTLGMIKSAVVIPQAAIILRGTERSVYVIDADKKAQIKSIQLRHAFGDQAVVEGIAAGASVVLDGKQNLRPGAMVRTQPAAINPAAAAAAAAAKRAASAAASGSAK
jgi:RND family efflux transporter MFP subunit